MSEKSGGRVLLSMSNYDPQRWHDLLSARRDVTTKLERPDDPSIDYAVLWHHRHGLLDGLPNLKAIFSVGAGVDHILADPHLPDVPVVRVVADRLTQYMSEYIVWRVLDHQRQGMRYRAQQARKIWAEPIQPAANDIAVGIMGFGELGRDAARVLLALGFQVNGWGRSERIMPGVATFHGADGLTPFLGQTDILVVLLPLTPATRGIVDFDLVARLRRDNALGGGVLINAGRGALQKEADILRALETGILKEVSLDVFETEPLPAESPLWSHPRVFITPHAASNSDPVHLSGPMLEQMDAFERGEPLTNVVDREAGY